jgi:hypothetical protein
VGCRNCVNIYVRCRSTSMTHRCSKEHKDLRFTIGSLPILLYTLELLIIVNSQAFRFDKLLLPWSRIYLEELRKRRAYIEILSKIDIWSSMCELRKGNMWVTIWKLAKIDIWTHMCMNWNSYTGLLLIEHYARLKSIGKIMKTASLAHAKC